MKKILSAVVVVLGTLTACTVQNQGLSYDDVYYSTKDKPVIAEKMNNSDLLKSTTKVEIVADSSSLAKNEKDLPQNDNGDRKNLQQDRLGQNNANSYVTDNYDQYNSVNFNYDDYYDYGYAARIRRFQNGFFNDYYHDYYTNRYWYDMNPGYWGSSIYSYYGFNSMYSYYSPGFGFGFRYGYSPFSNFYNSFYGYNDPFYSPYYYGLGFGYGYGFGLGFGYNGYYGGGYYGGYYGGGYYGGGIYAGGGGGGYYNSHDYNNSAYYGPRRGGSSNGPTQSEKTANAQRYGVTGGGGGGFSQTAVNAPRNGREVNTSNGATAISGTRDASSNAATMPVGQNLREKGVTSGNNNLFSPSGVNNTSQRSVVKAINAPRNATGSNREYYNNGNQNGYTRPVNTNQPSAVDTRSYQQQQDRYRGTSVPTSTVNNVREGNAPTRYYKPTQETGRTQTYNNPAYSRPRSGNEYTSPSYRNPYGYSTSGTEKRAVSNPERYAPPRPQSVAPVSTGSNRRESSNYSSPSNNSSPEVRSYSAPSRSYSAPSSSSYSAPSSPSYSAPSSSSSSGNSRESGSSSSSSSGSYNGPRR